MWTSTAQVANKILLLTRTAPKAAKGQGRPTDGITLFYTDLDRAKVEVRRIPKHGRAAVDSNAVFIDELFIPDADRIGEEGRGFHYLIDSLNPERILVGVEAIGIGQDKASLIRSVRLQIQDAAGKHVGRDHVEDALRLVDLLALQPEKRQPLPPCTLTRLAIGNLDRCVAIRVALNHPFKPEIDQRRWIDNEFAGSGPVLGGKRADREEKADAAFSLDHGYKSI